MDSFLDSSKDRSPKDPAAEDAVGGLPSGEGTDAPTHELQAQPIGEPEPAQNAEAASEQDATAEHEPGREPEDEPAVESHYASDDDFGDETGSGRRQKVLFCLTIGIICAALIALIWVATLHAVRDQRADAMQRAKAWVEAQANLLTESAQRELTTIDQSLVMLEAAYRADPQHFSLRKWQQSLPGLNQLVKEFFIANRQDIIVQDTLPQAVGQGIGGAYATFGRGELRHIAMSGQASPNTRMLLGEVNQKGAVRQYLMYLVRAMLDRPGWLVGASYRSSALVKVFGQGGLGVHGLATLIDTRHGGVQAVAGPAAVHPKLNVAATPMYEAFQDQGFSGLWTGPSGIDGVVRIHAFHRVPGRDLIAVVGLDLNDWMAPTDAWAEHARELAALASLLVLAVGGFVLWWLWTLESNRRLRDALDLSRTESGRLAGAMRSALDVPGDRLALAGGAGRMGGGSSFDSRDVSQPGVAGGEMYRRQAFTQEAGGAALPGSFDASQPGMVPTSRWGLGLDPADDSAAPPDGPADSTHLVERAADRLLRAGALESSAANLPRSGAVLRGGDVAGLPPSLDADSPILAPQPIDLVALERAGMVDWSRTRSRVSEEFRLIQRQLLTTAFGGPNVQPGFSNLVMVTSARPGEGKSFMSLNLAGSISRQGDHSVLLIDADSKRDSFCYPLGLADAPGLLDLAANPRLDAGRCIVKTPIDRLSVLPIGRERERGPELFSSKEMARLIQALGRRYSDRLVILDAPPCLSTSDPALLASAVGQVVMVVEAERTQRDEVEAALELMEECPNLMMVLNKQRAASRFNFGAYASYYSS